MSDIKPPPRPRPVAKRVVENPVAPEPVVEQPIVSEPDVDLVPIPQDFTAESFRLGWFAALDEVELQWSHGSDGLTRFLATQKRDRV